MGFSEGNNIWMVGLNPVADTFSIAGGIDYLERFTIRKNGNIGLGTKTPYSRFSLKLAATTNTPIANVASYGPNSTQLIDATGTDQLNEGVLALGVHFGATEGIASGIGVHRYGTGWGTDLRFYAHPNNTTGLYDLVEVMRVQGGGNVGIGTTTPSEKLHVSGNIYSTGNISAAGTISAKYQDVAEWVPTIDELPAGTIVSVAVAADNHVIRSEGAYDTRVAGVVSPQPGIALGEAGANKVLIATTGRVRIHVDATHAPITRGDLLVASNIPGVAMKSEPVTVQGVRMHRPGTIIGKALEPLDKGRGEILALLTLQ